VLALASHGPFSGFESDTDEQEDNHEGIVPRYKRRGFKRAGFKTEFVFPTRTVDKRAPVPTPAPAPKPKLGRSFFRKRGN